METIESYTRPGRRIRLTLRRRLCRRGIKFREINIRRDPDARPRARATGNDDEAVPTCADWLFIPSVNDVAAHLHEAEIENMSMVLAPVVVQVTSHCGHIRPVPPAGRREPFRRKQ